MHEVETMAWTNQVPWHGLGKQVGANLTAKAMLKAAGLDWRVERRQLWTTHLDNAAYATQNSDADGTTKIDDFAALVRDSDNAVFDVVGRQYTPTQNEQAFEFFKEFVEAGKAKMETAGSLRGGRYVWGLANLNASFKLRGGDQVNGYLLCMCPHQQGKSLLFKFTAVRVVCMNTLALSLRSDGGVFKRAHRSEFDSEAIERAKITLGIARDQLGDLERTAKKLQAQRMTHDKTLTILAALYAPKVEMKDLKADFDKHATRNLKRVMQALENAPGAQPDNAWGVLNAVTYYADHMASRSADKRLTNAWLGKTAIQKERVLDALLAL